MRAVILLIDDDAVFVQKDDIGMFQKEFTQQAFKIGIINFEGSKYLEFSTTKPGKEVLRKK